jgi:transcriptional antiterminator RfaH
MRQWYTLYTKPNAEYQVAATLQKRGIETYLAEIESPNGRKGREKKPFFPCYLFVRVDFDETGLSQVQWTPGLRRIVAFDDRPVPLSDEVINLIRHRLEGVNAGDEPPIHPFHAGETVRITDGPLVGMQAVFEGPSTPSERVQVLLTFLGQASRAYISVNDLEKDSTEIQGAAPKRPRRTRGRGRPIKN